MGYIWKEVFAMANTNINVSVLPLDDCELSIRKSSASMSIEYIISIDTYTGIAYLLDGESRNMILQSEDFGLAGHGVSKDTRASSFRVIVRYLLLRAKVTVRDPGKAKIIDQFCDTVADHMI